MSSMGGRRCLLVSTPLDLGPSSNNTEWVAIGNGTPVPNFFENIPFFQHWALCVIDSGDVEFSGSASRDIFLRGKYFDLSVDLETCFNFTRRGRLYDDVFHRNYNWPEVRVKSISAVQDMGVTSRFDEWIFQRGLQITSKWRKYLPLQWNCQHFALFLAQMSVNTPESNDCVQSILNLRRSQLDSILSKADWGGFAFVTASCLIPVIGGAVGAGMAVGLIFSHRIHFSNLKTVQRAYIELESSFEELRRLRFGAYQGNKTSRP